VTTAHGQTVSFDASHIPAAKATPEYFRECFRIYVENGFDPEEAAARALEHYEAGHRLEALQSTPRGCLVPPKGWWCSREAGHDGPCAARPTAELAAKALAVWKNLPDDERNGERPFVFGFNAGWEEALQSTPSERGQGRMLGLVAYVTGLPLHLRWSPEFTRYVNDEFEAIAEHLKDTPHD
jgi:hypothetical protein